MAAFSWEDERTDVSELFTVNSKFGDWKYALRQSKSGHPPITNFCDDKNEKIKTLMGIDDKMANELSEVCGVVSLTCTGETLDKDDQVKALSNVDLETAKQQMKYLQKENRRASDMFEPVFGSRSVNDSVWVHELIKKQIKDKDQSKMQRVTPGEEVLIAVQIFKPYSKMNKKSCKLTLLHDFHVLGSTELCQLRDAIRCTEDLAVYGDFSENPSFPQDVLAKDVFKSAFFYFEGTFYNDLRDPDSMDYSKVLRDWSKDPDHELGPFEAKQMQNHTFADLRIKLGQPYCFMHQCDCEHLIIFTDIRLVHPDDCLDASQYPLMVYKKNVIHKICQICATRAAGWCIMESSLCPEDPCYLCESCFLCLHYDENNQKVGHFKAYVATPN